MAVVRQQNDYTTAEVFLMLYMLSKGNVNECLVNVSSTLIASHRNDSVTSTLIASHRNDSTTPHVAKWHKI